MNRALGGALVAVAWLVLPFLVAWGADRFAAWLEKKDPTRDWFVG